MVKKLLLGFVIGVLLIVGVPAVMAKANPFDGGYQAGCERIATPDLLNWLKKRTVCDGPRRPDGSWERYRRVWTPEHTTNASSSCYRYSCTYYPSRWYAESTQEETTYIVFDDNVVAGEPGWLPPGTANLIS